MLRIKFIKGYRGFYKISEIGEVESLPRNGTLGGVLKPDVLKGGYRQVTLRKNSYRQVCKVHRLVAQTFIPNPNNYPFVLHNDGDPSNNAVSNLRWGTAKMNMADKNKHGTHNKGERHGGAKLKAKDILEIRNLSGTKQKSYSQLSKIYKVSRSHIGLIVQKKSWSHIK